MNLCKEIDCPFFSDDHTKSWGCQRWKSSGVCHLKKVHPELDSRSGYVLDVYTQVDVAGLRRENEAFFQEDRYYGEVRSHYEEYPEDFEGKFVPRKI